MNDGRLSGIQVLVRGSGTWSGSVASACLGRTPQGALQSRLYVCCVFCWVFGIQCENCAVIGCDPMRVWTTCEDSCEADARSAR